MLFSNQQWFPQHNTITIKHPLFIFNRRPLDTGEQSSVTASRQFEAGERCKMALPETIFVQTDPAFNVVLKSLNEISNQNRLHVIHLKTARIQDIQSNNPLFQGRFIFGGTRAELAYSAFGRTASAAVRMCMLEAVNVPRTSWPRPGRTSEKRNKEKIFPEVLHQRQPAFHLANARDNAMYYWSKFDHLYPHFRIEHEVRRAGDDNGTARMPSMMLIFRESFAEIVEITTTFNATPLGGQRFDSYIHVTCVVRRIDQGEDGIHTKRLKSLIKPVQIQDQYFEKMTKVKEEDLDKLPDAFSDLEIEDEDEQHKNPAASQ